MAQTAVSCWDAGIARRILDLGVLEPFATQDARVTLTAGEDRSVLTDRIIAGVGQVELDALDVTDANDLRLALVYQRRDHAQTATEARLGAKAQDLIERVDELRPAVGVARVVEGVDADEDGLGADALGDGGADGEEDEVAGGHVGHGDRLCHGGGVAPFGDADAVVEGRAAP